MIVPPHIVMVFPLANTTISQKASQVQRNICKLMEKKSTLELGDRITLTTRLGTRTYEVTSVSKVSETDRRCLP